MYLESGIKDSKGSITKAHLISEKSTSIIKSTFETLPVGKFIIAGIPF